MNLTSNVLLLFTLVFSLTHANASDDKKNLCDSLGEKNLIFDKYERPMRSYALEYKNPYGNLYGTDVFEGIQYLAQCKKPDLNLDLSIKYAYFSNVMYFISAKDLEKTIQFFDNEYLKLLNYIAEYPLLSKEDSEKLLSFKNEFPLLLKALDRLAQEFGAFDYSTTIIEEMGSISERHSENKIIIDCRKKIADTCHELWYILEKDNKRTMLNRLILTDSELRKKMVLYDKDYFKATEHFATWIYAAVASELIIFSPIIIPIAVPALMIAGTVEGIRYVLVRKNHAILYKSTVNNKDKVIGKNKFQKMIEYIQDIQFNPFLP